MEPSNDWDLQAVVRSCGAAASSSLGATEPRSAVAPPRHKEAAGPIVDAGSESFLGRPAATMRGLEYLNLDPVLPFSITPTSGERAHGNEVLISFPAASTSGQSKKQAGRNAPRPKKSKKSQLKKVVCEVPVADGGVSTDLWAWRKYGQKPIKGSSYPRGYYKCSSMKACMARKLVERNPEKPEVLIVTYIGKHCHAVPTMLNSLAGTTRHKPPSPDQHSLQMSDEASPMIVDGGAAETPDDESNLWPVDMSLLDEYPLDDFLAGPFDDDVGVSLEDQDEQDGLGRRMSL